MLGKNILKTIANKLDIISLALIVFLVPIFFSWFFWGNPEFELNKTILFRVLLIATFLLLVSKAFFQNQIVVMVNKYALVLGAFLLCSFFISSLLANSHLISFWGQYNRQQGFYTLFFYVLFFGLVSCVLKSTKQVRALLLVLIASSTLVCIYGCFQLAGLDFIAWEDAASTGGRIFSSLGQPNFLGHFLILVIPLIIYFIYSKTRTNKFKVLMVFILSLHLFCLYFTYSRSAWIAILFSLFVFVIWKLLSANKKKIAFSLAALATIIVLSVVFLGAGKLNDKLAHSDSMFLKRIVAAADLKGGSVQGRLNYWKAGLDEMKKTNLARLMFGYGPDSLYDVFARNYKPSWSVYERLVPDRAHNLFFDTVLQFGLFGLSIWICFFIFLLRRLVSFLKKSVKDEDYYLVVALSFSLLAYFTNNLFSFSLSTNFIVFYLFLAMLLFMVGKSVEKNIYIKLAKALKIVLFILLLAVSVAVIFYLNIKFVLADDYYFKSKEAGNCSNSWKYTLLASQSNPFSVYYKNTLMSNLMDCLQRAKNKDEVTAIKDEAEYILDYTKKDVGDFHFSLNRAAISGLIGGPYDQYSSETFSFLENNYGSVDLIYEYHAYAKIIKSDYRGAISTLEKGISVLPSLDDFKIDNFHKEAVKFRMFKFYGLIGQSYEALGEKGIATSYYEKILSLYPNYLPAYDKLIIIYSQTDKNKSLYYKKKRKEYE